MILTNYCFKQTVAMGKYETLVKGSKDERIEQSLLSNPFRVVKRNYKQTERSENRMNYSFSQRKRERRTDEVMEWRVETVNKGAKNIDNCHVK